MKEYIQRGVSTALEIWRCGKSLQSYLWLWRQISLRTKSRIYHAVVRLILLYDCETWPEQVADERMLGVFDNDNIHRILHVRRRDSVPPLPYKYTGTARIYVCMCLMIGKGQTAQKRPYWGPKKIILLVHRRVRWFGHDARCPEGKLIKDLLLPIPPRTWFRWTGGQLKTCESGPQLGLK